MPDETERAGRWARTDDNVAWWTGRLSKPMLGVALLVIPSILLESTNVGQPWHDLGVAMNWFIWLAFLGELLILLRVAPSRRQLIRSRPVDVLIVVLTPPFLGQIFVGLRALRLLRVAQLLRLAPVVRWLFSGAGVRYAALFVVLVVLAAGEAYAIMQGVGYWEGVYWAFTTMATAGDPTSYATNAGTKALTVLVLLVGIGFFATVTGALAERFLIAGQEAEEEEELAAARQVGDGELLTRLDAMAEQIDALRTIVRARSESPT